jgi:hypothetical protein
MDEDEEEGFAGQVQQQGGAEARDSSRKEMFLAFIRVSIMGIVAW